MVELKIRQPMISLHLRYGNLLVSFGYIKKLEVLNTTKCSGKAHIVSGITKRVVLPKNRIHGEVMTKPHLQRPGLDALSRLVKSEYYTIIVICRVDSLYSSCVAD